MPRFFIDNIVGEQAFIVGEDANHITKSLRMKVGDEVVVCDKNEVEHFCTIAQLGDPVVLDVSKSAPCENEPSVSVTLYQAMPKSDKMEFIIQKAVELGITKIVPIISSRCISRPDQKSMAKKLVRYNKIAESAAKQSGRGIIPEVLPTITFEKACEIAAEDEASMLFYELGGKRVSELICPSNKSISFIIGSEGGFSEQEVEYAEKLGINTASLGKRILRCETAPIVALTIIMNLTENI